MKKLITLVFAVLLSSCAGLQTPEQTGLTVGKLLDQVQIAINEISKNSSGSSLPPLKSAEITVTTAYAQTDSGGASIFLSAKGEKSSDKSNSLTLTLKPNTVTTKSLDPAIGQKIAEYVLAAVKAVDEQKALQLSKLNIEVGLEIVDSKEGGIEIDISGVTVEGKKSQSSTSGHKLILLFEA